MHFTTSTSSSPVHFTNLAFPRISSVSNKYFYILRVQTQIDILTSWRSSSQPFHSFHTEQLEMKIKFFLLFDLSYGFADFNFVIGCEFCVWLICFPSLMCNCFVCCGGGGCCVVVSRFMEYSHLYPTVSKDTALCAGVRPCVARRCHGEWGLVS